MKKKKIIVTLGPSSLKCDIVKKMDTSGVDIFRINLSHTDIDDFEYTVKKVQSWTSKPVCPDTEGPQLRTGRITGKTGTIKIDNHSIVEFVGNTVFSDGKQVPLSVKSPAKILKPGNLLKIDFNDVVVQITEINKNRVFGRVITGGIIGSNKAVHTDGQLILSCFTKKDIQAFKISNKLGLKMVFLSYCSHADDIIKLRNFFNYEIDVISKIESELGLRNLEEICPNSDGILIDRGDLSRHISLEKVAFAQLYILNIARSFSIPVYVATNLMESMIEKSKPTIAEINDIVGTIKDGADGLVLAAETAIGKYPIDCVRIMSSIINEFENHINSKTYSKIENKVTDYLVSLPSDRIIEPHGGTLIQQYHNKLNVTELKGLSCLEIDEKVESDVIQISEGVYSPIKGFMDFDELQSVLDNNKLLDGNIWTLPILLQLKENDARRLPHKGMIMLKSGKRNAIFALLDIQKIQKIKSMINISNKWFGTDDINHPGVFDFLNSGEYILSGKPYLILEEKHENNNFYELTPKQTRVIFDHNGWHDIIGFHTRNVIHRGHEYIQKKALETTNADAIYISPVTGIKKEGDFTANTIVRCYEKFIQNGGYEPYGVLLGSFNTYSRYSGPREAVFTAICRKNFGCNYFIVGRDHTGVKNYYPSDASQSIFNTLDIGIEILTFDHVSYCKKRSIITSNFNEQKYKNSRLEISGTKVRDYIKNCMEIPEYLIDKDVYNFINNTYQNDPSLVFEM